MAGRDFGCDLDFDDDADLTLRNRRATDALLRALRRHHPELDPRIHSNRRHANALARNKNGREKTTRQDGTFPREGVQPASAEQKSSSGRPAPAVTQASPAPASPHPATITIEAIKRTVCEHFRITHKDIISQRRQEGLVRPRQLAIWLCRELTPLSFPQIAQKFGDRDHTTMLHACRRVDALMAREDTFAAEARSPRMLMASMEGASLDGK